MVNRRAVLRRISATALTGITAGTAGCGADDGTTVTDSPTGISPTEGTDTQTDRTEGNERSEGTTRDGTESGDLDELQTARERLGTLADDLESFFVDDEVEFEDIDASTQLEDIDEALSAAADAVETDDQRAQLQTLETLRNVLKTVLDSIILNFDEAWPALKSSIEAVERLEEHEVEVRVDPETGDILNPDEMHAMICGQSSELSEAVEFAKTSNDAFSQIVADLETALEDAESIESALMQYDEISAAAVGTAVNDSLTYGAEMAEFTGAERLFVEGALASHEAGMMWGAIEENKTGEVWCTHDEYEYVVPSGTTLDDVESRYLDTKDLYERAGNAVEAVDAAVIDEGLVGYRDIIACRWSYEARAADNRATAAQAEANGNEEKYAEHTNTAFDLEDQADDECA